MTCKCKCKYFSTLHFYTSNRLCAVYDCVCINILVIFQFPRSQNMGRLAEGAKLAEADAQNWTGHADWIGPPVPGWHSHLSVLHGVAQSPRLLVVHNALDALPLHLPGENSSLSADIETEEEVTRSENRDLSADIEGSPGQRTRVCLLTLKRLQVREQGIV